MGAYLNTRGKSTLAIGICGRCSRKFSLDDLYSDPNYPGLKVCRVDLAELMRIWSYPVCWPIKR